MSTKRTNGSGQFLKGTSGNPSGRPPGSRNHATLLMESLLEGEAEQLTQKAIELALGGDITALRLCLERLIPPRKDRPIHLILPPIENVQQIPLAMATVSTAIGEGEITPMEGAVLSNILATHQDVLMTAGRDQCRRELVLRLNPKTRATLTPSEASINLANRMSRLERRLGPPLSPTLLQVQVRAWITAFTMEELTSFEDRWTASEASGATSLLDIFGEDTWERPFVLRLLEPAREAVALEMTGKSYDEFMRGEAEDMLKMSAKPHPYYSDDPSWME